MPITGCAISSRAVATSVPAKLLVIRTSPSAIQMANIVTAPAMTAMQRNMDSLYAAPGGLFSGPSRVLHVNEHVFSRKCFGGRKRNGRPQCHRLLIEDNGRSVRLTIRPTHF